MVEIAVCGCREFEGAEANVVERLVIDTESLVRVLDKLMDGECGIVRLDHIQQLVHRKIRRNASIPQRQCLTPWDWEQQSTCTSFCQGIPRGFWKSGVYPYQHQFHHQESG